MKPNFNVSGKVAAITGAAGILCSTMAFSLAESGVRVVLLDKNIEKANEFTSLINAKGGKAHAIQCDVMSKDNMKACCDEIVNHFGKIDILINGAGGNHPKASVNPNMSFFDIPEDAIRFVFDLNFIGTLLPSQVFGEQMMKQGSGNILNICSMAGIRPLTNVVGYAAAKAAVANLTQWMATYFAKNNCPNIRVNAIAPGFFITEQNRFLMMDRETGEPSPRGKHVLQQTPMSRFGEPEELLGAVHYLISDAASFVTGVVLPIDGGFSVYSI